MVPRKTALTYSLLSLCILSTLTRDLAAFHPTYPLLQSTRTKVIQLSVSSSNNPNGDALRQTESFSMGIPTPGLASNLFFGSSKRVQHRDALIVGGGLAGLSAALYLSQIDPGRHITILDRENPEESRSKTTVASFAAAGMLAPQSERLPKGDLLSLCIASRRMYREFIEMVEALAKESGEEGTPYLWEKDGKDSNGLDPWSVGFVASGGFIAPAFAGDSVATWAPPEDSGTATWLDANQVRELEPSLHPEVVGGWWFPEDASVDARRLTCSLRAACIAAGVQFLHGENYEVTSLDLADGSCKGVWLKNGRYIIAKSILIANGAWMRNLLPVPIEPHKGQSISLRMPKDRPPLLRRVLFAQDSYIVPKADGRIVVGATVEAGSYDSNVTPAGLLHVISHALQLVPGLRDLPIEETWVGLRPTTPDKGPILGKTQWDNLFLAGGYWRNGVLLAPKTGLLLATLMSGQPLSPEDQGLLDAFAWERFTSPEGSIKMAANSRYAAAMHPIHSRTTGSGVSAAVGTELGSYSSAPSAKNERQQDRSSLWGSSAGSDEAFERAAAMGKSDASAFSMGEKPAVKGNSADDTPNGAKDHSSPFPTGDYMESLQLQPYEGSADAYTVGASAPLSIGSSSDALSDLNDVYKSIRANKAQQHAVLDNNDGDDDERPDPGFRIYHKDTVTGVTRMVPPYTSPGEFKAMLDKEKPRSSVPQPTKVSSMIPPSIGANGDAPNDHGDDYNEHTFDGYQTIQKSNARDSRDEELAAMREARRKNRIGQTEIDPSKL
jgi:thiazole synthase